MRKDSVLRTMWRLMYPLITYFMVTLVIQMIMIVPSVVSLVRKIDFMDYDQVYDAVMQLVLDRAMFYTFVSGIFVIPVLYLFFYMDKKRFEDMKMVIKYVPLPVYTYVYPAMLGIVSCVALNNIIDITGLVNFSSFYKEYGEKIFGGGVMITFLASVIMAPILEELLFRGLIYKRLRFVCKPVVAGIISSVAFGMVHGNLVQFVYAFFAGMLLAYVYEKYKNLWAPIVFHFCANAMSLLGGELIEQDYDIRIKIALSVIEIVAVFVIYRIIEKKISRQVMPVDIEEQGEISCTTV